MGAFKSPWCASLKYVGSGLKWRWVCVYIHINIYVCIYMYKNFFEIKLSYIYVYIYNSAWSQRTFFSSPWNKVNSVRIEFKFINCVYIYMDIYIYIYCIHLYSIRTELTLFHRGDQMVFGRKWTLYYSDIVSQYC